MSTYSVSGFWASGHRGHAPVMRAELLRAIAAKEVLMACLAFEEAYDVMILNYLSFEKAMLGSVVENMVDRHRGRAEMEELRRDIDRHLVNMLAGGKMCQDHVLRRARRAPSRRSGQAGTIEAKFQEVRDRFLGFRAMELLRNAILHQNLPITSWTQAGAWIDRDDPNARLQHTSIFAFEPDLLAEDREVPQTLIEDLRKRADRKGLVSWLPLVREYVEGLSIAHQGVRDIVAATEIEAHETLSGLVDALCKGVERAERPIISHATELNDEWAAVQEIALLFDYEDRVEILRRQNRPLTNLHIREIRS